MTCVLDASAAFFLAQDPDGLDALATLQPEAPALLWSEVTALLNQQVYRRDISANIATEVLQRFLQASIDRVATTEMYEKAADLAAQLGWVKTYDAEYVTLALMHDLPLVTLDARLRRRVEGIVTVLTPDDALA